MFFCMFFSTHRKERLQGLFCHEWRDSEILIEQNTFYIHTEKAGR